MSNLPPPIPQNLMTLRILWGSFLISLVVFGVVLSVVELDNTADPTMLLALSGVALTQVPMLFGVRFLLLGPGLGLLAPDDLRAGPFTGDLADELGTAAMRYQSGSLVGFAMAESIAIIGFVCAFLSAQPLWYVGWASVSVLLTIVQFPRLDGLLAVLSPEARRQARQDFER